MIQSKQEWNEAAWRDIARWEAELSDQIARGYGNSPTADTIRGWITDTLTLIAS